MPFMLRLLALPYITAFEIGGMLLSDFAIDLDVTLRDKARKYGRRRRRHR